MTGKGFTGPLEKRITALLADGVDRGVFPGAAAGISLFAGKEKIRFTTTVGHAALIPSPRPLFRETFFDLASLTKPLATTLALLCLVSEGRIDLDDTLPFLLPREIPEDKKKITLRHLLNHSAGLAAHRPFYENLITCPLSERKERELAAILGEKCEYPPGEKAIYSDLGFILLGMIIESQGGCPLDVFVRDMVMAPLLLAEKLLFNPLGAGKKDFAATEECPWRGRILSGEVHDDNTAAMGGVSGQAGLFGRVDDVLHLCALLLDIWKDKGEHAHISGERFKEFVQRQDIVKGSSWALGFDTPSPQGSSAGRFISPDSVGHLGFTGTSFWIDPHRELVVVLLTNRVHPSRDNHGIKEFRPLFHEAVTAEIDTILTA